MNIGNSQVDQTTIKTTIRTTNDHNYKVDKYKNNTTQNTAQSHNIYIHGHPVDRW